MNDENATENIYTKGPEMKINGGKITTWYDRSMRYFNLVRSVMIVSIWLTVTEWSWWYLAVLPFMILMLYYDITTVLGQQIDYNIQKSEIWQVVLKKLDDIHQEVVKK